MHLTLISHFHKNLKLGLSKALGLVIMNVPALHGAVTCACVFVYAHTLPFLPPQPGNHKGTLGILSLFLSTPNMRLCPE